MSGPYGPSRTRRFLDVSKKEPTNAGELAAQYNREFVPSFRQLRAAIFQFLIDIDNGSVTFGGIVIFFQAAAPVPDDKPDGSVAITKVGVFNKQAGVWIAL